MVERTLNEEQKIRRAEEIYYRRKNVGNRRDEYATLNIGDKKDYRLFRKMILQIVACLFIYLIFFAIQNNNYVFSEQFINKTREILSYDVNFEELKNMAIDYYDKLKQTNIEENNVQENNIQEEADIEATSTEEATITEWEKNVEENIEENVNIETSEDVLYKEEVSSVSQVEEDSTYIKNNYSLIKPLDRNDNLKIWSKKSNNSYSSKVSYRDRYFGKYRNKNYSVNGGSSNSGI